jgi:hypothetical protein
MALSSGWIRNTGDVSLIVRAYGDDKPGFGFDKLS